MASTTAQSGCFSGNLLQSHSLHRLSTPLALTRRGTKSQRLRCVAVTTVQEAAQGSSVSRKAKRIVGNGTKLIGCGSAVPSLEIHNDDFSTYLDTSNEWILPRTGIERRRVLSGDETLAGLAVEAGMKALQMANVEPEDVDLVVLCSSTPEDLFGSGPQVQRELGCRKALAFDLTAACSGFILGLVTGTRFIKGGGFETALVIGADALSRYVDWDDRGTCILFGDAAGAVVLRACPEDQDSLLGFDMHTDGDGQRHLHCKIELPSGEEIKPKKADTTNSSPSKTAAYSFLQMNGKEVFRFAVRAVPQVVEAALEEAGLQGSDIDWLLLHQANQRILDAVSDRLSIPQERVISNLVNYGNTSAASIPLALDEAVRSGRIKPGDVIASAGFGAGLTWASAIFKWG